MVKKWGGKDEDGVVEGMSRGWEKKRMMKERVARLQSSQDQHSDKV
jgi:hypothetical protein